MDTIRDVYMLAHDEGHKGRGHEVFGRLLWNVMGAMVLDWFEQDSRLK